MHNFYKIGFEEKNEGAINKNNFDNIVFKSRRNFIYDYSYYKHYSDSISYKFEYYNIHCLNSKNLCCIGVNIVFPIENYKFNKNRYYLDKLLLKVYERDGNDKDLEGQTLIKYVFFNLFDTIRFTGSNTGVIEDEKMVFVHHYRSKAFTILEYSPTLFIEYPLIVGKTYSGNLSIPEIFAKELSLNPAKSSNLRQEYLIDSKFKYDTKWGCLEAYKIVANGKNDTYGSSRTTFIWNEEVGLLEIDFQNIDSSRILFTLIEIK